MKLQEHVVFGFHEPQLDRIVLSQSERTMLHRVADLIDNVRSTRNARVPTDWYSGDEDDSDMCFAVRICRDLADDGGIDAPSVSV